MESILQFGSSLPVYAKAFWIIGVMTFFWIFEGYYSFVKFSYKKWEHAKTNLILLGFVMLINVVFGLLTAGVFSWLASSNFGLIQQVSWPLWFEFLCCLAVLDLVAQYGAHYALHKVPVLWRLHIVHHSDTHVDVTSGTRHHPLDFCFRELAALVAVVIMGMPLAFYLLYRLITIFFTYWTHANIKLPEPIDKLLSYVIVTPRMHKVHHHHELPHTDTNFGNMFSIWDRIFGTIGQIAEEELIYGVDVADAKHANDIKYQLGVPWNKTIK